MKCLLDWFKKRFQYFAILPVDPYRALGIEEDATDDEIKAAFIELSGAISVSRSARIVALIVGQSPARLERARNELLHPLKRKACDDHISHMTKLFGNPPYY